VVCGYNPCGSSKLNSGTTYQQQRRYLITKEKDLTCPQKRFHNNLKHQLEKWQQEGDRLIVCMDANKDIYRKSIGKSLTERDGLNMVEVVGEFTGKQLGPTFFRGSKPIDRIWATPDITVTHACVMSAGFGVGDHRLFVINFQEASLVGEARQWIARFTSRRLNTKASNGATQKYLRHLEANLERHKLIKWLGRLHTTCKSKWAFQRGLNKLDTQSTRTSCSMQKRSVVGLSRDASPFCRRLPCGYVGHKSTNHCCAITVDSFSTGETSSALHGDVGFSTVLL
jgi:hypothetical protein